MPLWIQKIKKISHKPVDDPFGYVVAISGAAMQMMCYGIDNSFSIFSSDMQNDASLGYPSATTVSFGNSVSLGLSPFFGVFAGFLVDRVPPQLMTLASTLMLFTGLWLGSTVTTSSLGVTFSFSLLASVSSAFMLSPGAAATASWFDKRIGLGQGINFCGGGVGSSFIPAVAGKWVEMYGWRRTFQLMSSFCSFGLLASIFSCRRHEVADEEEPIENEEEVGDRDTLGTNPFHSSETYRHLCAHNKLMEALHTRKLSILECLRAFLTIEFLANFFMFTVFGFAFYSLIYITVPYVSSMGVKDTVYENIDPISTSTASTVFTFWGVFQVFGSILVGAVGSGTNDSFAYCVCSAVGGVLCALLVLCRGYLAFAFCLSIVGFCTAGMFAMMPALVARCFYGPNLGLFMGCVFLAGCIGGFSAPPMQAKLQLSHHGNYSYGCLVISACMTIPGLICYFLLWNDKEISSKDVSSIFKRLRH